MPFPVLGSNSAVAGFEIDNSLRFNTADSPSLAKTFGADGSATQFCISAWVKRSRITGTQQFLLSARTDGSNYGTIKFSGDNKIQINLINSGLDQDEIATNAVYRDVSAWYHLFFRFDKTQASLSDGIKLYVNNVLQTWGTTTYAQNQGYHFGKNGTPMTIGNFNAAEAYADFYLSEVYYVEGELKNPTDFGEVNDNGVWVPKEYEGNFGDEGFFLEFKNSGALGTDTSGNGNNFTATNLTATDQTTDTPTNNFCTLNPLAIGSDATLAEGNCQIAYGSGTRSVSTANMGFANGKWYWEFKITAGGSPCSAMLGIGELPFGPDLGVYLGQNASGWGYAGEDGKVYNSGLNPAYGNTFANGDIISVAFDADNGNLYFYKNGTIQNSGTAAATGLTSSSTGFYYPAVGDSSGVQTFTAQANFGNAPFTISSGNSDANGYGNFEYAVPSGYYSLCTKNLAEYG